jgi:hypothetical protein
MSNNKKSIRPNIINKSINDAMTKEEQFQNEVLRPILKMQHRILILIFKEYIKNRKILFAEISNAKRKFFIENSLSKDIAFKSELKGMIIGQFTEDEFEFYTTISSDVNKRIINLLKERFLTSITELLGEETAEESVNE